MRFSEKYGYVPKREIQIESMDEILRKRLINVIESYLRDQYKVKNIILDKFGYPIIPNKFNSADYDKLMSTTKVWYRLYDIIDLYFDYVNEGANWKNQFSIALNEVLEQEKAGYRVVNEKIVPITNPIEIATIQQASITKFDAVNIHIAKALDLYADRNTPDYENSMKESISAVESICCIITGLSGAQATLGKAIKKLEENGITIHPAMVSAFEKLFGYTCDGDKGIRHAGINFDKAPSEDAKFMLVSCSAFINYLTEKMQASREINYE